MVYEQKFTISASQTDATVRLGTAEAFGLLQDGMTACLDDLHCDNIALRQRGMFWIVYKSRIEFFRRPAWRETVCLTTFPTDARAVRTHLNDTLTAPDGEVLLRAKQELVPLSARTHRPCRLSEAGFPDAPYLAAVCDATWEKWGADWPDAAPVYRQTIRAQHTDMSGHVNNVAYVRLLLDAFSRQELLARDIREMEVRYDRESREGDELTVCRAGGGDAYRLVIRRDTEVICRAMVRF